MDDWNADLDDLLASSDDDFNKPQRKSTVAVKGKPVVKDDNFYASLAAKAVNAGDNDSSDVSEADPLEIAKQIEGLDDMDAALFGGMKSPRSGSSQKDPPVKSSTTKIPSKNNIADYDDPLADILGENNSKPHSLPKKQADSEPQRKEERPRTGERAREVDESGSLSSRRLDMERPPTRSGQNSAEAERPLGAASNRKRGGEDIMFDEDDVLGGMGLDSPREAITATRGRSSGEEAPRKGGAKSILDDLLGGTESGPSQKSSNGANKEFVLDKKYTSAGPGVRGGAKKELEEEDFQFGSYMPSSAGGGGNTGSRPSSRRSVRFEDDDEDDPLAAMFSNKATTSGKTKGSSGHLENIISNDSRDWLDIATNSPGTSRKQNRPDVDGRPRSAGNVLDTPNPGAETQPGDWFGMSRIGSPEGIPGTDVNAARDMQPGTSQGRTASDELDAGPTPGNDDWLTKIKKKKSNQQQQQQQPLEAADKPQKSDDWLGIRKEGKADDWLGASQEPQNADDWLGVKGEESGGEGHNEGVGRGTGYLGLGEDVDLDSVLSKPAARAGRRSEELFASPPKKNLSDSLPWEKPQKKDPTGPARSASGKGLNLADSPHGLNATLDALVEQGQHYMSTPALVSETLAQVPATPAQVSALPAPSYTYATSESIHQVRTGALPSSAGAALTQQQQLFHQQQTELQREVEERRQKLQQQQEHQMRSLQMEQQALSQLQQQQTQLLSQPLLPDGSLSAPSPEDLASQVRKLQLEKSHLLMMMETIRMQHNEEQRMVENSYRRRMELLEETQNQREARLKEEVSMMSSQMVSRLQQMEGDKADLVRTQQQRLSQLEQDKDHEMVRVKDMHRNELSAIKVDHAAAFDRLRQAKDLEIETVSKAHDTTRGLTSVISQVQNSAADLGELSHKVESQHLASMGERDEAARSRDQQLKVLQERLGRQQHENEMERAHLQALVTKLEIQLTEQTRHLDEEKWSIKQKEAQLKSMQTAVDNEKKALLDEVQRERSDMDRAKDKLLAEQQTIMQQLNTERKQLAEERAQFTVSQRIHQDQDQRESAKQFQVEMEMSSTVKAINDEKSRLDSIGRELALAKKKQQAEQEKMADEIQATQIEKEKLEQIALQVRQRSKDIEDMCSVAAQAREEGQNALQRAKQAEAEQSHRLNKIQADLQALRNKERQIAEERLSLAREKQEMEKARSSMLCVSCRTPIRDTVVQEMSGPDMLPAAHVSKMTPAAQNLFSALGSPELRSTHHQHHTTAATVAGGSVLQNIATAIEMDRSVCTWRLAANRDKDYLAEETMFLEAIKHAPYHPAASS